MIPSTPRSCKRSRAGASASWSRVSSAELLAEGSEQADLWGINLYPDLPGEEWLELDSMNNLRPSLGNRSRGVEDPGTREAISTLVGRLVRR